MFVALSLPRQLVSAFVLPIFQQYMYLVGIVRASIMVEAPDGSFVPWGLPHVCQEIAALQYVWRYNPSS